MDGRSSCNRLQPDLGLALTFELRSSIRFAALILFAISCSDESGPLHPPDASFDAGIDAGSLPISTCENGVLEPGEACFGRTVYPIVDGIFYLLSTADRDGDGLSDLLTLDPKVLLSRGGDYVEVWSRSIRGGLAAGDVDGDGIEELVAVFTSSGAWWKGERDGSFTEAGSFSLGTEMTGDDAHQARLIDVGRDGVVELLIPFSSSDRGRSLLVLAFDGATFEGRTELDLPTSDFWPRAIDWDGDGVAGEFLVDSSLRGVLSKTSDGQITILEVPPLGVDPLSAYFQPIELDGQAPTDFAVASTGEVHLYRNLGGVLEALPALTSSIAEGPAGIRFVDADADPEAELLEIDVGRTLLRDLPSGVVLEYRAYEDIFYDAFERWDVDGDGRSDLTLDGHTSWVRLRGEDGSFGPASIWGEEQFYPPEQLEADGDALLDLVGGGTGVILGRRQDTVRVHPETITSLMEPHWTHLVTTDLDADRLDDVVGIQDDGTLRWMRGDGADLGADEVLLSSVSAFDASGVDVAVALDSSVGLTRYEGGMVLEPLDPIQIEGAVSQVILADFTGDAIDDVVYRAGRQVGLLIGDGTGRLERGTSIAIVDAVAVLARDLERDGSIELIVAEASRIQVLGADLLPRSEIAAPQLVDLVLGDFDGDGDLDAAGNTDDALWYWEFDGASFDAMRELYHTESDLEEFRGVESADVDGDGRDELVLSHFGFPDSRIEVLSLSTTRAETLRYFGLGVASIQFPFLPFAWEIGRLDLDANGAADLVMTRGPQLVLFYAYP